MYSFCHILVGVCGRDGRDALCCGKRPSRSMKLVGGEKPLIEHFQKKDQVLAQKSKHVQR